MFYANIFAHSDLQLKENRIKLKENRITQIVVTPLEKKLFHQPTLFSHM
jgi:hypothetical protein